MTYRKLIAIGAFWCAAVFASTALAAGMTSSDSKVQATAQYSNAADSQVEVRLTMADGWHVNANPASLDFLIPTSIEASADGKTVPVDIDWPDGHDSGIDLGDTAILVYSNNTVIPVKLDTDTSEPPTLDVRVQACSDKGVCLPPSTLSVQPTQS